MRNNIIAAADIKFEEGKEKELLGLSKNFIENFTSFMEKAIVRVSTLTGEPESTIRRASIYQVLGIMMQANQMRDAGDVTIASDCAITDMKGVERNVFFKVNISDKHSEKAGGFFSSHHAGGFTASPELAADMDSENAEAEMEKARAAMAEEYAIPNMKTVDRVISVDMSAWMSFNKFLGSKDEATMSIFGVLGHELSHAYDTTSKKEDKKYKGIQKRMHGTRHQISIITKKVDMLESQLGDMFVALLGETPGPGAAAKMAAKLKIEATKLDAQYQEFFKHYINTKTEMRSALKELRLFVNAMATGEFVAKFRGIKDKFKTMSMIKRQDTVKELLESIGTWHHISQFLTPKNRILVFKFIYRILSEPPATIALRESYPPAPAPQETPAEEFEVLNDFFK